ncbi:MAG TPA: polysaccharide biosynthesis/export family protein [Bryobacteraceae bacterium]|jgi:polysaccharide export outer membrane protein|nr:polysaccharide biosynthesis/export family protein [Bryobacteraceae bacterium]
MNRYLCFLFVLQLSLWSTTVLKAETLTHPAETKAVEAAYVLGPADQLSIHIVDLDDVSDKPVRIDPNGYLELPLIGRISAGGLTLEQLRSRLAAKAAKYIESPEITINVLEYRSRAVSILGPVTAPGLHQLQGPTRLTDVISLAGGLRPDAGQKLTITRQISQGTLPLPSSHLDPSGQYSIADLHLNTLLDGSNPKENIEVRANDVISVSRADLVYVMGEVKKAGGFSLNSDETMSITQALSLAEGTISGAATRKARILRAVNGKPSNTHEVPVDLTKVLSGAAPDLELHANDVLFVPNNLPASAMKRALEAAIQAGTGVAIYRF